MNHYSSPPARQRISSATEDTWLQAWTIRFADECRHWRRRRNLAVADPPTPATDTDTDTAVVLAGLIGEHDHATAQHGGVERVWMASVRHDLAALPSAFGGVVPPQVTLIEAATGTVPMYLAQRHALYVPAGLARLVPLPLLVEPATFTRQRFASSAWVLLDAVVLGAEPSVFLDDAHFVSSFNPPAEQSGVVSKSGVPHA